MAVVGYVPEYRFHSMDWDGAVSQTTHLVLFSLEPTAEGDVSALERLQFAMEPNGAFMGSLHRAGASAPKVLISIGGAGRSEHFPSIASMAKRRKRFARRLAKLLADNPALAGVDLDWEVPKDAQQWRDFGKLAREIRDTFNDATVGTFKPLLTMTYHPITGAVGHFSGLQSKGTGMGFVDYFDMCHAMAYSQYDNERRHSSMQLAEMAIDEWVQLGLPTSRLTLGVPFFGVSKTSGQAASYGEILDKDQSLTDRPGVDESQGMWFNNANMLAAKVKLCADRGLAGLMIWELGQDKPASSSSSLLKKVWKAARQADSGDGWWNYAKFSLMAMVPSNEQQCFVLATVIIGAYMFLLVLSGTPPGYAYAAKRKPKSDTPKRKKPTEEPAGEPAGEPAVEPAEEPTEEPAGESAAEPPAEDEASTEMPKAEKSNGKSRKR